MLAAAAEVAAVAVALVVAEEVVAEVVAEVVVAVALVEESPELNVFPWKPFSSFPGLHCRPLPFIATIALHGMLRQLMAWHAMAYHVAYHGMAWHSMASHAVHDMAWPALPCLAISCHIMLVPGMDYLGRPRHDTAWN